MNEVFFVSAKRSPIGRYMGSLKNVRVQDLAAATIKAAVEEAGIDSGALDMSIYSQSLQSSMPANIGRHAWTLAGLDENPAGYTLNTLCAGALQTMISGFNKIVGDDYGGMLVGGVDSYSMAQYYIYHPRYRINPEEFCFHDPKKEVETNAQPRKMYGDLTAAAIADEIAARYSLERDDLDSHVLNDRRKLLAATDTEMMIEEIVPVSLQYKGKEVIVSADDYPPGRNIVELTGLPPLRDKGLATTGNMTSWADGAAALVMLSGRRSAELGCAPLAKMTAFGIAAGNPRFLEKTTVRSMEKALAMDKLSMKDIDFIDIHSPSAAYALAVANKLGPAVSSRINGAGSSLSFGHSGAATGGVMAVRMIKRLRGHKGKRGLVNVGALGGQSLTVIIEGL